METTFDFSGFSRQSPKGIIVYYFQSFFKILKSSWIFVLIFISNGGADGTNSRYIIGACILLGFILTRSILQYLNFKYKISDHHFILKQGILNKKHTSISFDRIQNINFKQNLIQQVINVIQVEIETAGAKSVEISIKALSREKAEALKAFIVKNKSENTIDFLDESELESKQTLLNISLLELVKVSITENHFKSFGIFMGLLLSVYSQLKDSFEDSEINSNIEGFYVLFMNAIHNSMYLILGLSILGVLVAVVISFIIIFLRHFNLSVTIDKDVIEINQGLLTKRSTILKREKVQYLIKGSNPLKKWMGIHNMTFKQAVSGKVKMNKQIRIVGCKEEHSSKLKELLFSTDNFDNLEMHSPEKYYIVQMAFRSFLFAILLNLGAFILFEQFHYYIFNLVLIPLISFLIYLKYTKSYFKINDSILIKGSGQIETKTTFFEYFKIQNIQLTQSFFQKRKQVANLVLGTASGVITIPCISEEKAKVLFNYMLYKTESSTEKWM